MEKSTKEIVEAYKALNNAKLGKIEDNKSKIAVIKVANKLKKVYTSYTDFEQDAIKKLRPEDFDGIESKLNSGTALTPAETLSVSKFNKEVAECLKEEQEKICELDFETLSETVMEKLIGSNDFTVAQIMSLYEVIAKQ